MTLCNTKQEQPAPCTGQSRPYARSWPTAVDLFCGCGGMTAALKARHFRVVAAVDFDSVACRSYRSNHPSVHLYEQDIAAVDPANIHSLLRNRRLDILAVCSPCQPFSQQNRSSRPDDRAELLLSSIRFAQVLSPRLILFENVPGLTRRQFAPLLDDLRCGLTAAGYELGEPKELNAADYGVPQRRLRCVMLARHGGDVPTFPAPTTPDGNRVTVAAAIGGLPTLASGEADKEDALHFARQHQSIALERLRHIPKDGGSRDALPARLRLDCHRNHSGHPDVYGRMRWSEVAPTLTTGCTDVTRGRFAHPRDDRAISLREAARLQTFPDNYRFSGSAREIAAQVGNAVPVQFIEALTPILRAALAPAASGGKARPSVDPIARR